MEQNQKNFKNCEICEGDATCLCFKCKQYFCENCYKLIHDKKKNNSHEKEKIDFFVPVEIKCPEHPEDRINLFCVDEKGKLFIF